MRILPAPPGFVVSHAIRDLTTAHPLLQQRWNALDLWLFGKGFQTKVIEVFRYDARQAALFGQGRSAAEIAAKGLDPAIARPALPKVTNAWSAAVGAHGWTREDSPGVWVPGAAALDFSPVGKDGIPFTPDDPWDVVTQLIEDGAARFGLRHFRNSNGRISDTPHVQLSEWNDHTHTLDLTPSPLAA